MQRIGCNLSLYTYEVQSHGALVWFSISVRFSLAVDEVQIQKLNANQFLILNESSSINVIKSVFICEISGSLTLRLILNS